MDTYIKERNELLTKQVIMHRVRKRHSRSL